MHPAPSRHVMQGSGICRQHVQKGARRQLGHPILGADDRQGAQQAPRIEDLRRRRPLRQDGAPKAYGRYATQAWPKPKAVSALLWTWTQRHADIASPQQPPWPPSPYAWTWTQRYADIARPSRDQIPAFPCAWTWTQRHADMAREALPLRRTDLRRLPLVLSNMQQLPLSSLCP